MSRFALATMIAALALVALALSLGPPGRWWAMGAVAAAYLALLGLGVAFIRMGFFAKALCRGKPGGMRVALTFDDGPDPEATPRLLDLLKDQKVPATFFCIGERASARPDIVRRMAQEGHAVGNHTSRHAWWTNFLFGRRLREEIGRAQETLRDILGRAPRYFRSPAGLTNPHLPGALSRLGLTLVGWDVRPFDRGAEPQAVIERVARQARDGSVIVLHDGGARAEALVRIVAAVVAHLRSAGYTLVSLDELEESE
jgi:peptidoglycan/xylan/chitin deacetylase (PgdA/CDA1 family)